MATWENASLPPTDTRDPPIEFDTFASPETDAIPAKVIIASFNIRYAVGSHLISGSLIRRLGLGLPSRRKALISRHIKQAAEFLSAGARIPRVDILGLQESDKQTDRAGGVHVAQTLAQELKMHYAHASRYPQSGEAQQPKQWYLNFEEHIANHDSGETGLAMLSRFTVRNTTRVDLPGNGDGGRSHLATETILTIGSRKLTIYNAHIDVHASTDEQLKQHLAIIDRTETADGPTVLMGDFNTLSSESRDRIRGLLESYGYTTPFRNGVATWRSGFIRLQTDWIFVRDINVSRSGVARGLNVSDHWPVWVELALNDQG